MSFPTRALQAGLFLWPASLLSAQASPYVALDDPRLPAFEHLVRLGDVADPAPLVRPIRRSDAVLALDSALARGSLRDSGLVAELRQAWAEDTAQARWEIEARVGGQGYTEARRDPLHPAGPDGVRPYAELRLQAAFDKVILVSRPAIEPRLTRDPDWPGRRDLKVTGRHVDGYLSVQTRYVRLLYGQLDQNWGPVGLAGLSVSDYGYPRTQLGLEIGNSRFQLSTQASTLTDAADTSGAVIHRYFFAHRISARVTSRLHLGLWETMVLAGPDRSFDGRYRNPVTLLLLANQYGLGDDGNILVGLDAYWRVAGATVIEGQLALDDLQYENRSGPDRYPDRYAFTLAAAGPLRGRAAWRASYTQASSLAFRSTDPFENFTEQGVGIGRAYSDNDQLSLTLSHPLTRHWLVSPEFTLLRQGEGRLDQPIPSGAAAGDTPTLFIGTVERTWRAAVGISGHQGALALRANVGVHQVQNANHVPDRNRTRLIGRIQATLGLDWAGRF